MPAELDARQHTTPGVLAYGRARDVKQLGDLVGGQQLVRPAHGKPPSLLRDTCRCRHNAQARRCSPSSAARSRRSPLCAATRPRSGVHRRSAGGPAAAEPRDAQAHADPLFEDAVPSRAPRGQVGGDVDYQADVTLSAGNRRTRPHSPRLPGPRRRRNLDAVMNAHLFLRDAFVAPQGALQAPHARRRW
jgi:hypothetical protein